MIRWAACVGLFALFCSCSRPASYWHCDSIAAGQEFDSSRLIYSNPGSHLKIEWLRIAGATEAFCFLDQFTFQPVSRVIVRFGDISVEEEVIARSGRMKVRLSDSLSSQIIFALQEGREVDILISGLSETIRPDSFKEFYTQFLKGQNPFANLVKGPLE